MGELKTAPDKHVFLFLFLFSWHFFGVLFKDLKEKEIQKS